jgi:hypothetical protein
VRIRRSKGAFDGFLLILLGLWGGLIPFVGPYFNYAIGNTAHWHYTSNRLWLSILPGVAVALGGLILLASRNRVTAWLGAELALAGGIWFVVGQQVSTLWHHGNSAAGTAFGGTTRRFLEEMGFFYGLGALVTALAAFALGRLAVRSVRDAAYQDELAGTTAADRPARTSRFRRDRTVVDRDGDGVDDREETPRRGRFFRRTRTKA